MNNSFLVPDNISKEVAVDEEECRMMHQSTINNTPAYYTHTQVDYAQKPLEEEGKQTENILDDSKRDILLMDE